MKKILLTLATLVLASGAMAQINRPTEQMLKQWRQSHGQRDFSTQHLQSNIPLNPAIKSSTKYHAGMPTDNVWFPGEWEEVQAIVVTPYYSYFPAQSQGSGYWIADPLVAGYATYYQWSNNDWQQGATGPYIAEIDTSSDFGNVSFYLMDAIQLGGAQAWVRVEQFADTNIVLRKLQRMGLRHNNIRFLEAPGNSFWYRDCGPICFYYGQGDTVAMLDFEYYPGRALDDSLPVYIERQFGLPNFTTSIEWEGGNCLVDGTGMVLSSDHIYSANADATGQITWDGIDPNTIGYSRKTRLSRQAVYDSMQHLIGPRATHILPAFRYDGGTGHVDLYADMIDENKFIFSAMPDDYWQWADYQTGRANMDSLCSYTTLFGTKYRCQYIPFPSTDNGSNFPSQTVYNRNYTRTYSNHTFVNNVIIQPCFSAVGSDGMPTAAWDRANIEQVKEAYPGYTIYCVDVREFDGSGGAIHCITKQIPAEHPIRILHNAITSNTGTAYTSTDLPLSATITNIDGISSAKVVYRIGNGSWQEVALTPGANNQYTAQIPTAGQLSGSYTQIDYYISATSNAGKTITKPMTAEQGGYYTLYLGTNPNNGIDDAIAEQRIGHFYPNPATTEAHIGLDLSDGSTYAVSIVDPSGRTVHTSSVNAAQPILYTIDTRHFAAGTYHVVFASEGRQIVRTLIVR